jgi:methyl-accepting chemotaxis protein
MKNVSIRTKILAGVVIVNLVGMITVMIYLHQSYSGALDVGANEATNLSLAAWQQINSLGADEIGPYTDVKSAQTYVDDMKSITGADYGLLLDKSAVTEAEYAKAREAAGLPNNWADRETYVLIASTNDDVADEMQLEAPAADLPEIGKLVGVENGACSKTCHGAVQGSGDFWKVRWSKDSVSRAHGVFPVTNQQGAAVGTVYLIKDISSDANTARTAQVRTMFVIMFGLIVSTALIAMMLNAFIFNRLNRMVTSMEDISVRVAGGDFDARFEPDGSNDEIGRFEQFFARFLDLVGGTLKSLVK